MSPRNSILLLKLLNHSLVTASYRHIFIKIRTKMRVHEAKTRTLAMPYKNSETRQQKSRKCVFRPFLNRNQKKLFYSFFQTRPKYYESSKTEYSDSSSFINQYTPLIFFGFQKFFEGLKGGFLQKISTFFCFCLTTID